MGDDRAQAAAAAFAENLRGAIGSGRLADIAAATGIDEGALRALVEGRRIPDLADVVALQNALDVDLWPALPN